MAGLAISDGMDGGLGTVAQALTVMRDPCGISQLTGTLRHAGGQDVLPGRETRVVFIYMMYKRFMRFFGIYSHGLSHSPEGCGWDGCAASLVDSLAVRRKYGLVIDQRGVTAVRSRCSPCARRRESPPRASGSGPLQTPTGH